MSNAVFPTLPGLAWSVFKTPQWATRVQRSTGGNELRASYFSVPIWKWRLTYEFLRESGGLGELRQLISFYNARQGMFDSFLYTDPSDCSVVNQLFGIGDGATTVFQLQRTSGINMTFRANLVLRSEEFENVSWTKSNAGSGSLPVVTPDADLAPDGSSTADRVVFVAPTSGDSSSISQAPAVTGGVTYTGSFWVKAFAAGDVGKTIVARNVAGGAYTNVTLGASWQRIAISEVAAVSNFEISLRPSVGGSSGTVSVSLWGAQLEAGAVATPYIRTGSAIVTVGGALWPATADAFEPVYNVNGTPRIFVNGVLKTLGTDYTLSNGLVTFLTGAPANGALLLWFGNYYWRVRFDLDSIDFEEFLYQLWKAQTVSFVSVKGS